LRRLEENATAPSADETPASRDLGCLRCASNFGGIAEPLRGRLFTGTDSHSVPVVPDSAGPPVRAPRGSRKQQKNGPSAAHFELPEKEDSQSVNNDEIIKGWQEVKLNVTNPINFDKSQGKFTVTRRGLYYLYCQVHFRDRSSAYLKLFVKLNDRVVFNCLQSHTTTPSSGHSILQDFNSCHVSGLIELPESAVLTVHSIRGVRIHYSQKLNYFGLFKVK
uniref:TNF superfamily member 12 n=1 Tax=Erpetoichthys calabaricus TaxID=27687 RepID=A0A8C4SBS8_ERPCA